MKILIFGAGNTGHAVSAYLSELGQDVFLYTRSKEKAEIINNKGINSYGKVEGNFKVNAVCKLDEIVSKVQYIFIFTTANVHRNAFELIKDVVVENQKIIVFNSNWGAYEGYQVLNDIVEEKKLIISETGSMPFIATSNIPGEVNIANIKNETTISAIFPNNTDVIIEELQDIFPNLKKRKNIIETSLSSTNPVIHVPISIFNGIRIENGQEFKFYDEGISKLSVEYIINIDKERIKIAKKLGIDCGSVLETINSYWPIKHDNLYDALNKNTSYKNVIGPKTLEHRYFTEDIPFGIVPIIQLGKLLEIETPYSSAIVNIASLFTGKDYLNSGVNINFNLLDNIIGG